MTGIDNDISDRSTPTLLNIENEYKMVIYERELKLYSKTNSIVKVFAVKRGSKDKPKWELEFQIKGETERALLVTSLNKARQFPRLNQMVEMLLDWCPDVENVNLGLHFTEQIKNNFSKGT